MSIVSSRRRRRDSREPSNGRPIAVMADDTSQEAAPTRTAATTADMNLPDWSSWRQLLMDRRRAQSPAGAGKKNQPLLWGVHDLLAEARPAAVDSITRLAKAERGAARSLQSLWSSHSGFAEADNPIAALRLVAWARNLAGLAEIADEQEWWALANGLADVGRKAREAPALDGLTDQLLSIELGLTLAHWLAGRSALANTRDCVWLLEKSLLNVVDDDGLARETPRRHWLPLLACWTRCRALAQSAAVRLRPDAHDRYQDFVESLLRLAGGKGLLAWPGQARANHQELDLWHAAAGFVHPRLRRAMNVLWPNAIAEATAAPRRALSADLPPSAARSERAAFAVLRPTWSSARLTIDYAEPQFRLRLDRGADVWFDGTCAPGVVLDGRTLAPQASWEEICWITDDDVDYLELRLNLDDDVRVERHVLFAREDEFIFLADAVLGTRPADIDYDLVLPCDAGVSFDEAAETRELTLLRAGRRRAVVLPLALGEWRAERGRGELIAQPDGLRLTQTARQATNLFAPCFIDVSAKRLRQPVTWRRLTVAEERETQAADAAVGYRVQVGRRQWLFYRSLTACGNRTLLGHNLIGEFLAARFSREGVPETLIEIEPPAHEHE